MKEQERYREEIKQLKLEQAQLRAEENRAKQILMEVQVVQEQKLINGLHTASSREREAEEGK